MRSCPGGHNSQLFPGICFAVCFELTCPTDAMAKATVASEALGSGDHGAAGAGTRQESGL